MNQSPPTILLLSCYELGHQPLSLAWPLAALAAAGYSATAVDLAVQSFPARAAEKSTLVFIATPMHTALRLGVTAAQQVRKLNPSAHICFFGHYAWTNADYLLQPSDNGEAAADSLIAGESEDSIVALVQAITNEQPIDSVPGISTTERRTSPQLVRLNFPVPDRRTLPPLDEYAHYTSKNIAYKAGYVEASRGCLHTCTHCPVVPIYNGRFFIVPVDIVMADIRQQVAQGAQHITFGDPDFLNGPRHAQRIAQQLHDEFPDLTFDFTTKVEHLIEHEALLPELKAHGATFVISAFEMCSNVVLERLEKGHTVAQMEQALAILDAVGLSVQPTWVPFTPWTSLDDYLDLLAWIRRQNLIYHVPAIQLAIRLLVPPNSALLKQADSATWFSQLDAENFTYRWQHADSRMDELHAKLTVLVEQYAEYDDAFTFRAIEKMAYGMANRPVPPQQNATPPLFPPPRLTEDWFC